MKKETRKQVKKMQKFYYKCLYQEYRDVKPIQKNTVMYQAYRPKIMAGNPYAIFKELIHDEAYKHLTHYWIYGSDAVLDSEACKLYLNHPRVKFVKADTKEHMKALATCEYLVNNAALPDYWIKREDQIYINTWHGTPLKSLGKHAIDRNSSSVTNAQRNFFLCDYMVMPNQYTVDRMLESYDITNMVPGAIIDAGYPRVDLVLDTDRDRIIGALETKMGESLKDKKIALYAPTFRSVKGKSVDSSNETCRYVEEMVEKMPEDYVVFFKIHNMLSAYFAKKENMKKRLIFDEIETNELLSVVDVLITDYSSIFFDYLCTKKPILFFVYDREEYETQHGLYIPMDDMPGELCYTVDELIENINKIEAGTYDQDEKYAKTLERFAYNDDGHASRRCVDIIFGKDKSLDSYLQYSRTEKKKMMLHVGGLKSITDRNVCFAILQNIDYDKYDVSVCGSGLMHFSDEFTAICPDIKIISGPWDFTRTLKEAAIIKVLQKVPKSMYKKVYERQFRRLYGENKFDTIVSLFAKVGHWDKMLKVVEAEKKVLVAVNKSLVTELVTDYCENYDEIFVVEEKDRKKRVDKLREIEPRIQFVEQEKLLASTMNRKLHALFISAFDSTNYVFVNIIKELRKRGHKFTVVVRDEDDFINTKMYINEGIPFIAADSFEMQQLNNIDFVFSAPLRYGVYNKLMEKIQEQKKFIITFANLFSSIVMRVKPDLCFCIGQGKIDEFKKYGLKYNCVAIGNPQYDTLIEAKKNGTYAPKEEIKKVLIIDQGGYPFGVEGKTILGNLISKIAKSNPDMEFTIKPRYLPDESGRQLHKLSEHLYDYIPEVPDNLILLKEPTILEELILGFDAAMTTWSTAFLDAAVLDMPTILIDGIPSQDIFDVRLQRVEEAYGVLRESGCVQDYHDLMDGKLEFHKMSREFLKDQMYSIDDYCAPRVVDVLEWSYAKLIVAGKKCASFIETDYEGFQNAIDGARLEKVENFKGTLRNLYQPMLNDIMQQFVYESRCYGNRMNPETLLSYWDFDITSDMTEDDIMNKIEEVKSVMAQKKADLFADMDTVMTDPILEDYYLDWLMQQGRFDDIFAHETKECPESIEYYKGVIALRRQEFDKSAAHLKKYYEIREAKEVENLRKDRDILIEYFEGEDKEYPLFQALYDAKAYPVLERILRLKRFSVYVRTYYQMLMYVDLKEYEKAIYAYENNGAIKTTIELGKMESLYNNHDKMINEYIEKSNELYAQVQKLLKEQKNN